MCTGSDVRSKILFANDLRILLGLQQCLCNLVDLCHWLVVVSAHHIIFNSLQLAVHFIDVVQDLLEVDGLFFGYAVGILLLRIGFCLLLCLGLGLLLLRRIYFLVAHKYYNFDCGWLYFDL